MRHVEGRRTFLSRGIPWILGRGLEYRSGRPHQPRQNCAGVVQRLRIGVARLQSKPQPRRRFGEPRLQRVISGMRAAGHDRLRPESADGVTLGIELGKRRKVLTRASVSVWVVQARQMNPRGCNIRHVQLEIVEFMVNPSCPAADVAVSEVLGDACNAEQLNVPGRERIQIILKSYVIKNSVGTNILRSSGRKNWLSLNVVGRRKVQRHKIILESKRLSRLSKNNRSKNVRDRRGQRIVLPQVWYAGCEGSPGMQCGMHSDSIFHRKPRAPPVPVLIVRRLRIDNDLLYCVRVPIPGRPPICTEKNG